jgi:hypothetical protein
MAETISGNKVLAQGAVLLGHDEEFTTEWNGGRVTFRFEGDDMKMTSITGSPEDLTITTAAVTGGAPNGGALGVARTFVRFETEWTTQSRRLTYTIIDREPFGAGEG